MPPKAQTVAEAFRHLRAEFEDGSHQFPGLDHFWVLAAAFASDKVLEAIARKFGKALAEVTKWPDTEGLVEYSCFLGGTDTFTRFRELARDARTAFTQFMRGANRLRWQTAYDAHPHVAWMADVYAMAADSDAPLLRVEHLLVGEYAAVAGPQSLVYMPDDKQNKARLKRMEKRLGQPRAVHRLQRMEQDIFSASVGMLDTILHDASETTPFQAALASVLDTPGTAGLAVVDDAPKGPVGGRRDAQRTPQGGPIEPLLPAWVNMAETIGPISHTAFAKLLNISAKHLYREIANGHVWKGCGPTKKRFYFHLQDPKAHRRLREDVELGRRKRP